MNQIVKDVLFWIGFAVCVSGGLVLVFRLFSGAVSFIAMRRLAKIKDAAGNILDRRFDREITDEEFKEITKRYLKQRKEVFDAKKDEPAEKDGKD